MATIKRHSGGHENNFKEINALRTENARLIDENKHLRAKLDELAGTAAIKMRTCAGCFRSLPDGPAYFPGYFESSDDDLATEMHRQCCIYCR